MQNLLNSVLLTGGNGLMMTLLYIVFIGGLMYFMIIRPQKKQQDAAKQMISSMKIGSPVITIGGLHGIISAIDEAAGTVDLDCEGVILVFERRAISKVFEPALPADEVDSEVEVLDGEFQSTYGNEEE